MDELWEQDPDLPRARRRSRRAATQSKLIQVHIDGGPGLPGIAGYGGGFGPPPAAEAIAVATRPQDWAEPARTILFGQLADTPRSRR